MHSKTIYVYIYINLLMRKLIILVILSILSKLFSISLCNDMCFVQANKNKKKKHSRDISYIFKETANIHNIYH